MMDYKLMLAQNIVSLLDDMDVTTVEELLEYPPNPELGDIALPCFKLSKLLRKSPQQIAEDLQARLPAQDYIERVEAVSGYLNIYLDKMLFSRLVIDQVLAQQDRYGSQNIGQGRTIVIDYSSPNIAKPFHVGHLRTTVIGNALYNIFDFLGYHCVGVNHLGDWGTQFGKLIVAYKLWGNPEQVEADGINELLRLYIQFHDEAERNPELEDDARAWFVKLEQGDAEATRLWRSFIEISLIEFNKIYDLLGIRFDAYTGESFYNDKIAPVLEHLKAVDLLEEDEGALLVRLDDYDMPPVLMVKKDGSSLYHSRDVAAAIYRKQTYDFEKCIYVTDYAQNLHFQQLFKLVELMGNEWAKDLVHVSYGRVSLEGIALSTRKGNVIKLEELLTQAIEKTREIIDSKNERLANKEEVARQVGIGAVIFNDLSNNRMKDIVFSWDEALNFEGETGPYVQYTHARTCSLLRRAAAGAGGAAHGAGGESDAGSGAQTLGLGNGAASAKGTGFGTASMGNEMFSAGSVLGADIASVDVSLLQNAEALDVIKQLYFFVEKVEQAMLKLEPSIISRHLIDIAQSFNRFYHECPILVEDQPLRFARLALVKSVRIVLRTGLALIGVQAPEQI